MSFSPPSSRVLHNIKYRTTSKEALNIPDDAAAAAAQRINAFFSSSKPPRTMSSEERSSIGYPTQNSNKTNGSDGYYDATAAAQRINAFFVPDIEGTAAENTFSRPLCRSQASNWPPKPEWTQIKNNPALVNKRHNREDMISGAPLSDVDETIMVLFGRPGAGKSTIAESLLAQSTSTVAFATSGRSILWLDLDICVPQWMRDNFAAGVYPTLVERASFAEDACAYVSAEILKRKKSDPRPLSCVVSFSFVNDDLRDIFRARFPRALWCLVDTPPATARGRVARRPGHFYVSGDDNLAEDLSCGDPSQKRDVDNSDWVFDDVKFPHSVLDGEVPVGTNARRALAVLTAPESTSAAAERAQFVRQAAARTLANEKKVNQLVAVDDKKVTIVHLKPTASPAPKISSAAEEEAAIEAEAVKVEAAKAEAAQAEVAKIEAAKAKAAKVEAAKAEAAKIEVAKAKAAKVEAAKIEATKAEAAKAEAAKAEAAKIEVAKEEVVILINGKLDLAEEGTSNTSNALQIKEEEQNDSILVQRAVVSTAKSDEAVSKDRTRSEVSASLNQDDSNLDLGVQQMILGLSIVALWFSTTLSQSVVPGV